MHETATDQVLVVCAREWRASRVSSVCQLGHRNSYIEPGMVSCSDSKELKKVAQEQHVLEGERREERSCNRSCEYVKLDGA